MDTCFLYSPPKSALINDVTAVLTGCGESVLERDELQARGKTEENMKLVIH